MSSQHDWVSHSQFQRFVLSGPFGREHRHVSLQRFLTPYLLFFLGFLFFSPLHSGLNFYSASVEKQMRCAYRAPLPLLQPFNSAPTSWIYLLEDLSGISFHAPFFLKLTDQLWNDRDSFQSLELIMSQSRILTFKSSVFSP